MVGQVVMDLLEFEVSCKNPDRQTDGEQMDGGGGGGGQRRKVGF